MQHFFTHLKVRIFSSLLFMPLLLFAADTCWANDEPVTEEQLIQISRGSLKPFPEEIIRLVDEHGVGFFPTNTSLERLKEAGVAPSVIAEIRRKAASQMRIKVCLFESEDPSIAKEFAVAMKESLIEAKILRIEPFGFIPLDNTVGPPQGFDDHIKPEPKILYILLGGQIHKSSSGFSLKTYVIYRDPQGVRHPLPGAKNPPETFTEQTLEDISRMVVEWGLQTTRDYAAT